MPVESSSAEVTPVQKANQLLNGMGEKGKIEKHEGEFCDDTTVEMLQADTKKYEVNEIIE